MPITSLPKRFFNKEPKNIVGILRNTGLRTPISSTVRMVQSHAHIIVKYNKTVFHQRIKIYNLFFHYFLKTKHFSSPKILQGTTGQRYEERKVSSPYVNANAINFENLLIPFSAP
jgi:hypothetical protein